MNRQINWLFLKWVGLAFSLCLICSCDFIEKNQANEFLVPLLPPNLKSLEPILYWEVHGSCITETQVKSGTLIKFPTYKNGSGDWILARPRLVAQGIAALYDDPGIPIYGWVSGGSGNFDTGNPLVLDKFSGLGAALLYDTERGNGIWAGFNLHRFIDTLRQKGLDTLTIDYPILLDALMKRDVSTYDFCLRKVVDVSVQIPAGQWCNGIGDEIIRVSRNGINTLKLRLGTNTLFRSEDGAILRVFIAEGGDGSPASFTMLHQLKLSGP